MSSPGDDKKKESKEIVTLTSIKELALTENPSRSDENDDEPLEPEPEVQAEDSPRSDISGQSPDLSGSPDVSQGQEVIPDFPDNSPRSDISGQSPDLSGSPDVSQGQEVIPDFPDNSPRSDASGQSPNVSGSPDISQGQEVDFLQEPQRRRSASVSEDGSYEDSYDDLNELDDFGHFDALLKDGEETLPFTSGGQEEEDLVEFEGEYDATDDLEEGWTLHEDVTYDPNTDSENEPDHTDPERTSADLDDGTDVLAGIHRWLASKGQIGAPEFRSTLLEPDVEVLHQMRSVRISENPEHPIGDKESVLEIPHEVDERFGLGLTGSEADFFKLIMNIPETPAQAALSRAATEKSVADPILKSLELSEEIYESKTERRMTKCPSVISYFKQRKIVDVNVYLYPGKKMISKECRLDVTVYQLKLAISRYAHLNPDRLDFRRNRNLVADNKTLEELGAKPKKKMKFSVEINRRIPGSVELKIADTTSKAIAVPDTIRSVRFKAEDENTGTEREIERQVVIVHPRSPKPMLGGFVDKRSNLTYHHAETSPQRTEQDLLHSDSHLHSRDLHQACQTFNEEDFSCQTVCEKGVQMERDDYYISTLRDRICRPKPYKSYEFLESKRVAAAIVIQRYWRRWLAERERRRRMEGLIKRVEWAESIRKGRIDQRIKVMEEELRRQENPTRLLDLELLYRAINKWREEQENYVKNNRWGAERKAALATLTEMEGDLLLELERTKVNIINNGREMSMHRQFKQMSKASRWYGTRSSFFISFDTPGREKCRLFHEIYKALLAPVESTAEGTQARVTLIHEVNDIILEKRKKSGEFPLADMLLDLFTRELRFIKANCSPTLLTGVRRRVANTFFCLCKDPSFNVEAKRIGKIPYDASKLRKDMMQCKGCRRMQYRDEFTITKGTTVTTRCHSCIGLYRTAILRIDLNLYRQILNELRRDEFQAGVINSVAFLIDAFDMQFLVEQIWHGQSALSGIDNRYMLRLCRWKKQEPWAPWNCVLLTEEEAVAHVQLEDIQHAYQKSFFHKVRVKHSTAKTYFEGLAKVALGLDDRIKESCKKIRQSEQKAKENTKKFRKKAKAIGMFQSAMIATASQVNQV